MGYFGAIVLALAVVVLARVLKGHSLLPKGMSMPKLPGSLPRLGKLLTWRGVMIAIVVWEGVFGFYAMTDAPRLPGLGWVPHWGTPTLATAGAWVWAHWLPMTLLYGSIMAFLAIASKGTPWEKEAKDLRGVVTAVFAASVVLLPVLGWVTSYGTSQGNVANGPQEAGPRAYNPQSTWARVEIPPSGSTPFIELPAGYTLHLQGQKHMLITYSLDDGSTVSYHNDEPVPAKDYMKVVAFRFSNQPFRYRGKVVSYTWTITARYAFCPNADEVGPKCMR